MQLYVLALLCIGQDVLLIRRRQTGFGDGFYSMPGGKVDPGETARQAISREITEEVGLTIPESAFELVHTIHRLGTEGAFVALCFRADIAGMPAPRNMEPEKHDDMRFFNVDQLPTNILPAHKQMIECIKKDIYYSEHGW